MSALRESPSGEPQAGTQPAVRLTAVTAGYDHRPALEEIDLEIEPGSLVAIFGPNGGGKSTLLKLIADLIQPWSGTVEVLGEPAGRTAHRIAYVTQAELVDWSFPVSVWDVAMMGRYPRLGPWRRPGPVDHDAVAAALERVGMTELRSSQIGSLSGGQRRRAFLARAIASEPDLYLLDEPVTGVMNLVAGKTREGRVMKTLLEKLEKIRKELGTDKVFDVIGRLFEGVSLRAAADLIRLI